MPIKKYNIKNEEVAFLSANTWDVSGGGNYGFTSIWVNRIKIFSIILIINLKMKLVG